MFFGPVFQLLLIFWSYQLCFRFSGILRKISDGQNLHEKLLPEGAESCRKVPEVAGRYRKVPSIFLHGFLYFHLPTLPATCLRRFFNHTSAVILARCLVFSSLPLSTSAVIPAQCWEESSSCCFIVCVQCRSVLAFAWYLVRLVFLSRYLPIDSHLRVQLKMTTTNIQTRRSSYTPYTFIKSCNVSLYPGIHRHLLPSINYYYRKYFYP